MELQTKKKKNMKYDDIHKLDRNSYTEECPSCRFEHTILTQGDDSPEYYTEIYLRCQCGEYIEFSLPVN